MSLQRQQHLFNRARTIVFDVDNTLYQQTPELLQGAQHAFRDAAIALGCTLDGDAIIALGMKYHGMGDAYAIKAAEQLGVNRRHLHEQKHQRWNASTIPENPRLVDQLGQLKNLGLQLFAYSDAHDDWSRPALEKIGAEGHFPPNCRMTRDQTASFKAKHEGQEGHQRLRARSVADYREMILVDDSPRNLTFAKNLGMMTVLIGAAELNKTDRQPDFSYPTIEAFLDDFLQYRTQQAAQNLKIARC